MALPTCDTRFRNTPMNSRWLFNLLLCFTFAGLACCWPPVVVAGEDEPASDDSSALSSTEALVQKGEAIFAASCTDCHGQRGEGSASAYAEPLTGDLSIGQLAEIVSDTMPEGEPELCIAEDALAVATFMYESFYSEAAQIRNRPPRSALTRLTADQLRQSISDLFSQFEGLPKPSSKLGLTAEYYDGDRRNKEHRKLERVDPVLDFDFGLESPAEGINKNKFLIYWQGGIRADVTGRYEIIVRSSCSFKCNLGRYDREFIDNHVQSGDKTEFRRSLYLTAGRVYPFELTLVQRERKTENRPVNISLSWVPPNSVEQIIPTQHLISDWVPPAYALQAELPPDDRSYGFERGIAVNRQWDESTTAAALEFAQVAIDELWPHYRKKHDQESDENRGLLRAFLQQIVETAFREPLSDDIHSLYIDSQIDKEEADADAIKRVILVSLKSPRFLYPTLTRGDSKSRAAGNQLALILYDSLPTDDWLKGSIVKDELQDAAQLRSYAEGNVNDYRVRAKTRRMLYEWLNLGHFTDVSKSPALYPEFNSELYADLRSSLDFFLDDVVWGETSDYRQLFQARWCYTNERIAAVYGEAWQPAEAGAGTGLRKTRDGVDIGFGVLTHPFMMSGMAYHDSTSPIHRGVFLIRFLLGRTLRPPTEAFSPLSPDLHPDLTTRERVDLQTSPESCQVCHSRINGLGFALENYDAIGRFRAEEKGKAVDTAGRYTSRNGDEVEFTGAEEMSQYLTNSPDAHRAFVSRAFQHFVKQPPAAFGADTLDELTQKFVDSNFDIRKLIVEIAVVGARE